MMINRENFDKKVPKYFPYVYQEHGNKLLENLGLITSEQKRVPEIMRTARNSPTHETIITNSETLQSYYDSVSKEYNRERVNVADVICLDSFYKILSERIVELEITVNYNEPKNNLERFDDICFSINKRSLVHRV